MKPMHSVRLALLGMAAAVALSACGEPKTAGGAPEARRLSEAQYRHAVADAFGADVKVAGRFEPGVRQSGLLAVGSSLLAVSPAGFEQYDAIARSVAAQAVDEKHRENLACKPADAKAADSSCASTILSKLGRQLYRRPLSERELKTQVAVADKAAGSLGDFYAGLELGVAGLLESPQFLFAKDAVEPDPANKDQVRLTAYSKAQRLSFFLWDAGPDEELLAAAENGSLHSPDGLKKQVERMLASPRLETGVRAFFTDFLAFDKFASLAKDPVIYPLFSLKIAKDAEEQTLRTITDHVLVQKADYRDLFTTRKTFLTRNLGLIYQVRVPKKDEWMEYTFPASDPHAGIATQLAFTNLFSHPGRSSATLRGKAVREVLLCQKVPDPPANVNFTVVQETNNPNFRTARERLTAHRTDPTCAACHKVIDPIGLALENFDGMGVLRMTENEAPIDPSGDIDGIEFKNAAELGKALHDHPSAVSCVAESLYRYAAGRDFSDSEQEYREWLLKGFAKDGYRVPDLMRRIATSNAFFAIKPAELKTADAGTPTNTSKEAQQ